ncbi:MAG: hypothetical protein N2112_07615 [Gemmataceae bacterium]|jgi:hypothetical protein|nr:hypothetical protein [Gemmataceae bacterium]
MFRFSMGMAVIASLMWSSSAFAGGFWDNFRSYWARTLGTDNGIVMTVLVAGAISLFVITRGKWKK